MPENKPSRLVEVDALRGLAAVAVVLFHFTTRFKELFDVNPISSIAFPYGHYGVNLFFIISGFVIFMTLERTTKSMDFVVSRFSRLFPAYWCAIVLTFSVTHLLGLPGKIVDLGTALANMIMVHGFFRVVHVDDVYWTLEVELLFYCGMFLLYKTKQLGSIHGALLGLLLVRLIYYFLEHHWGINLPWIIYRLLILQYLPWFALGISVFQLVNHSRTRVWHPAFRTSIFSIVVLLICESAAVAMLAVIFASTVFLAASGRLRFLRTGPFVWLGTISYPLYLLHENIGWSLIIRLLSMKLPMDITIILTISFVLLLASAVTKWVEQPALRWIRNQYKSKQNTKQSREFTKA